MLLSKLLSKKSRNQSILIVTMLSGAAFIALAIWGWKLPLATAGQFLLITVVLLTALVVSAALVVFLWKMLRKLTSKD